MPPRTLLLNLGIRNHFICRSCQAALRKQLPPPWAFRALSHVASTRRPDKRPPRPIDRKESSTNPSDEARPAAEDDSVTIRYFEQDGDGRRRQFRDSAAFNQSMDDEVATHLDELEGKLRDTARLMRMIKKFGAKQEAEKLRRKYRKYDIEKEADDPDQAAIPQITMEEALPNRHLLHIQRLNKYVQAASGRLVKGTINANIIAGTWERYSRARPGLARCWQRVPLGFWDCLWDILSLDLKGYPNRMHHIHHLVKDMALAGVPPTGPQQLLGTEATFIEGLKKEAIQNWIRIGPTLGSDPDTFIHYWELGVRMCCLHGDLERARRAVDKLLDSSHDADPRILFPFVRAFVTRGQRDAAWEEYQRLRELLGSSMQLEDYDVVISTFLSANETEYAFHVFVDMMFSGAIDIHGRSQLPSKVTNHFFLGKWLKRLIGAGDFDGALRVLQFAQSKRMMTSAIQVNGLIGAWLRSGTGDNQERAEKLARAMIESRRVFVELRRREAALEWPIRLRSPPSPEADENSELVFVPQANIETYSLLAENYHRRGRHRDLEALWVSFKEAEIATDAFMTNQLLSSYAQSGKGQQARELYELMVHEHQIVPDAHTFLAVFGALDVNQRLWLSLPDQQRAEDAVRCRRLVRDMVESCWSFDGDAEGVRDSLPRYILHSFRKLDDYVGLMVALRTLRDMFGFVLSKVVTMELVAETSNLNRTSRDVRKRVINASQTIDIIISQHRRAAATKGAVAGAAEPQDVSADELATAVEQYYRHKVGVSDEEFQEMYSAAVEDLGVHGNLAHHQN